MPTGLPWRSTPTLRAPKSCGIGGQPAASRFDLGLGEPDAEGETRTAADWRNQMLRPLEAGRKAGSGIGRLGAILADLAPASVPWEVRLRGLLARALLERPHSQLAPSVRPLGRTHGRTERRGRPGSGVRAGAPAYGPASAHRFIGARHLLFHRRADAAPVYLRGRGDRTPAPGRKAHLLALTKRCPLAHPPRSERLARLGRDAGFRTGGGTDFGDLFAKAEKIRPSIAVILTDLDARHARARSFPRCVGPCRSRASIALRHRSHPRRCRERYSARRADGRGFRAGSGPSRARIQGSQVFSAGRGTRPRM